MFPLSGFRASPMPHADADAILERRERASNTFVRTSASSTLDFPLDCEPTTAMHGKSTRRFPDIASLAKISCNLLTSGTSPAPRVASDDDDDARTRFACIAREWRARVACVAV